MALMFEYKPGMSLIDPWVISTTRTQPVYQVTKAGTLQQVGANVLRDAHYIGGVRTTLFEDATINSCLQSQTLATAPWGGNQITPTNAFGTAPDGTATSCKLLPSVVSGTHYWTQNIAITDQEYCADSIYLRGGNGYNRVRLGLYDSGTTTGCTLDFNLSTGAIVASNTIGAVGAVLLTATFVPLANGWYRLGLAGRLNNIAPAITSANLFIYMMDNSGNTTFAGDGTSYIEAWGAQFERWGTTAKGVPTSYMPTTVGTASRNRDDVTVLWPYQTQPLWVYLKFFEVGWSLPITYSPGCGFCTNSLNAPRMLIYSSGSAQAFYTQWLPGTGPGGTNETSAVQLAAPTYGQSVEILARLWKDGKASTDIAVSVAGGAVATASAAAQGGIPITDFSAPTKLILHAFGSYALQVFRVGADPARITTLALAAAA